jgi:hypothetical protein
MKTQEQQIEKVGPEEIWASQFKLGPPRKSAKRRANEWWSKVTGR